MKFWLGTHQTDWLGRADFPLFVSHRRLSTRKRLPQAVVPWALDSGGFSEISLHGRWVTGEAEYVEAVRRYQAEIGRLAWAAPQDWMVEPVMLAKTGLTVGDHQRLTVANYCRLTQTAPDLPFIPVLQGWTLDDYLACVQLYEQAGVDLWAQPIVGVGSVCRRQHTGEVARLLSELACLGLRLHGFGVKTMGLATYAWALASADSMAWSFNARKHPAMDGCSHRSCSNCIRWAARWRADVLESASTPQQPMLGAVA